MIEAPIKTEQKAILIILCKFKKDKESKARLVTKKFIVASEDLYENLLLNLLVPAIAIWGFLMKVKLGLLVL